jgi:hypothetical protein
VSDTDHNRVLRQDLRSGTWTTFGSEGSGAGSFVAPLGLATSADGGVLYVADQLNNRIERFSMSEQQPPAAGTTSTPSLPQASQSPPPAVRRGRLRIRILGHRLRRGILFVKLRSSEDCRVTLTGKLRFRGRAKGLKLKKARRKLRAGVSFKVALRIKRDERAIVRRQTAKGRRARARLSLLAVGTRGERSRLVIRFRL